MSAANPFADPRLRELDPPATPVIRPLGEARRALARATPLFLGVGDDALERPWPWIGGGDADVRSGFYLALQRLEQARGAAATARAAVVAPGPTWAAIAGATEARWDLHGLLAPLADEVLDADPGGGEWTVRQTLAHALAVHRRYHWFSAWWLGWRASAVVPDEAPDEVGLQLPPEEEHGSGSLEAIRRRLDALVDIGAESWRSATTDELAARAHWSGFPVTVGFRLGRWGPHLEEHTIQVEKTLAMLDRRPREVDRMVRLLYRAFGRLEAAAWALPPAALERGDAAEAITDAAGEVERIAIEIA